MASYVTDTKAGEIPALQGLEPDDVAQALADADKLRGYLRRNEFATDDQIHRWAERNDIDDPDRVTRGLAVLVDTGRVFVVESE